MTKDFQKRTAKNTFSQKKSAKYLAVQKKMRTFAPAKPTWCP
jgi:hypothetical protein